MKWYLFSCTFCEDFKQKEFKAYNLEQAYNFALFYFRGYFSDKIEYADIKYYGTNKNE